MTMVTLPTKMVVQRLRRAAKGMRRIGQSLTLEGVCDSQESIQLRAYANTCERAAEELEHLEMVAQKAIQQVGGCERPEHPAITQDAEIAEEQ